VDEMHRLVCLNVLYTCFSKTHGDSMQILDEILTEPEWNHLSKLWAQEEKAVLVQGWHQLVGKWRFWPFGFTSFLMSNC
jgi:hypothetical protein